MNYSKIVFPQATSGFVFGPAVGAAISYNGVAPATATSVGAIVSPTWNPASANAVDRTQYWPDTAGTMSYSEVMIDMLGLATIVANQYNAQMPAYRAAVETSVSVTIGGTAYTIDLGQNQQALNLLHGSIANSFRHIAVPYATGTVVAAGAVVTSGGEYYTTPNGGTTGATAPVFPANSLTSTPSVNDNGVTWNVVQFATNQVNGQALMLNIAELTQVFLATYAQVNTKRATLDAISAALNKVTNALTAWTANAAVAGNATMIIAGNLYSADATGGTSGATAPTFNTGVTATTTDGSVTWTCLGDVMAYVNSQVFH